MKSRAHVIIFILFSLIGLLTLIYLLVLNHLSTQGAVYKRAALQLDSLQREDLIIDEQILEASAYSTIRRKAVEMGFVQMEEVLLY